MYSFVISPTSFQLIFHPFKHAAWWYALQITVPSTFLLTLLKKTRCSSYQKKVMIEISNNDDGMYEMNGWIDLLCSLFQRQLNILRTYIHKSYLFVLKKCVLLSIAFKSV